MATFEKIYAVDFMEYTDVLETTVSNATKDGQALSDIEYITIGHEPFLVPERYLDIYRKYGKGFRSIRFVGNMEIGMVDG